MRIKKVEISAFRAYNNVEDSTFDFTLPNNEVADFVSIYAPNGYGKTSFYDAVEWCITGQIERFHRNRSEYDKLGKEYRKANKDDPFFLQHNKRKDVLGSVNVFTDKKAFNRELTASTVYDFHKKASNIYFKEVILSQDLIDTFIKEDKAEDRYDKFVKSISSLKSYNNALKNIIKLNENTTDKIKALTVEKQKIEKIQLSLDFEGDEKILEEINKAIANLIESNESLFLIQKEKFSKNEFDVLTQKVNSRIIALEIEIEKQNSYIKQIDDSFNGIKSDENRIGVIEYNNLKKKRVQFSKQKQDLKETLSNLNDLKILERQLVDSLKKIDQIIRLNNEHTKIKNEFPGFLKAIRDIKGFNKEIDELNEKLEKNVNTAAKSLSLESDLNIDINQLQKDIKLREKKIEEIPLKKESLIKIKNQITLITKTSDVIKKNLDEDNKLLEEINSQLDECNYFKEKLNEDIEILLDYSFFENQKNVINDVLSLSNEIKKIDSSISEISKKIIGHEKLNTELSNFISKGIELTAKNESSSCILCTKKYNSYKELATKITNNKLLEQSTQDYLREKTKIELEKSLIIAKYISAEKKIETIIKKRTDKIKVKQHKKSIEIEKNNQELKKQTNNLLKLEEEKFSLMKFFEDKSIISFEEIVEKEIINSQEKLNKRLETLNQIKVENKNLVASKEKLNNKLSVLKRKIKEKKEEVRYVNITTYFNEVLKTNIIKLDLIENEINNNIDSISDLKIKNESYKNLIKIKNEFLAKNEKSNEQLIKEIDEVTTTELFCEKAIQNFEQLILTEYKIDLKSLDQIEINKSFENFKENEKKKIEKKRMILKNYIIVEKLKEDSYQFLESENTKRNIKILEKNINIYSKIKSKLDTEKNNLEAFLKKTIDSFFYTKLISKIYQKIDPHPDYNLIEFDCDFSEKNPRLQIYTVDSEGKRSIPSLYFSTAQVNVLSLSIFLARALKAKNPNTGDVIECIFIDDPVQSMDSINILSFIDLFRSIIVNMKRQLIVSSHEENFHLLLQKKIPKKLFKSKFINFESFGRLERNIDSNDYISTPEMSKLISETKDDDKPDDDFLEMGDEEMLTT